MLGFGQSYGLAEKFFKIANRVNQVVRTSSAKAVSFVSHIYCL